MAGSHLPSSSVPSLYAGSCEHVAATTLAAAESVSVSRGLQEV